MQREKQLKGMEFRYQFEEGSPKIVVTLASSSDLREALEMFEAFLRACGYSFEGTLDFVKDGE